MDRETRTCRTCGESKPLATYPNQHGYHTHKCRACTSAYITEWQANHPEAVLKARADSYDRHRAARIAKATAWCRANPEKRSAIQRRYRQNEQGVQWYDMDEAA